MTRTHPIYEGVTTDGDAIVAFYPLIDDTPAVGKPSDDVSVHVCPMDEGLHIASDDCPCIPSIKMEMGPNDIVCWVLRHGAAKGRGPIQK